jgi:hypothetical protein
MFVLKKRVNGLFSLEKGGILIGKKSAERRLNQIV